MAIFLMLTLNILADITPLKSDEKSIVLYVVQHNSSGIDLGIETT